MTIKIKETIERDCCEQKDLKEYKGRDAHIHNQIFFCQHCGQLWENEKYTDAAGSTDTRLKPVKL